MLTIKDIKFTEACFAQAHGLFEHCAENRSEIAGRGIDDTQHFRRCGLLLQSLARLSHQSSVLDRNDRLVRKRAHKLDLSLGEWFDSLACQI